MGRMRNKLVFEESMQLCKEDASLREGIIFSSDHQECIPYSALSLTDTGTLKFFLIGAGPFPVLT